MKCLPTPPSLAGFDRPPKFVKTDGAGHFILKGVVPGTYRVYAWEHHNPVSERSLMGNSVAFLDREFPRMFDNMSGAVTIGENESKQVSRAVLRDARTVNGCSVRITLMTDPPKLSPHRQE